MNAIIISIFILGYTAIAFEHVVKINKSASALITGVLCWTIYIMSAHNKMAVDIKLEHHLGAVSGILFFLLCAMTIVEIVDAHRGFDFITSRISQNNKRKLLWIIAFLTFFLSAALDNLTTTIVMLSLLKKLIHDRKERLFFASIIIIAANAGGAWSPIGDVTTTMLWMGDQISTSSIIYRDFFPSIICLMIPLALISLKIKGTIRNMPEPVPEDMLTVSQRHQRIVLFCGLALLLIIPVFKTITHLPPYMGALIALGIMWIITEFIHIKKEENLRHALSIGKALRQIDSQSILFFLGILLSVSCLETSGILPDLANHISRVLKNRDILVMSIGIISSIIDNVPLVAASQGMYNLAQYPTDHNFWLFLAYCAGTGGSILIIGSAAGIAAMGMEKISFFWYLRKVSLLALLGYFGGALAFIIQHYLF